MQRRMPWQCGLGPRVNDLRAQGPASTSAHGALACCRKAVERRRRKPALLSSERRARGRRSASGIELGAAVELSLLGYSPLPDGLEALVQDECLKKGYSKASSVCEIAPSQAGPSSPPKSMAWVRTSRRSQKARTVRRNGHSLLTVTVLPGSCDPFLHETKCPQVSRPVAARSIEH
jgi:hypothetical protein